jgi:hypothetical protein
VGVELSGKGGRRRWCRFNALVSAREERRRDEALSEDEQMQQARLGSMRRKRDIVRRCGDVGRRRGGTRERKKRRRCQLG